MVCEQRHTKPNRAACSLMESHIPHKSEKEDMAPVIFVDLGHCLNFCKHTQQMPGNAPQLIILQLYTERFP